MHALPGVQLDGVVEPLGDGSRDAHRPVLDQSAGRARRPWRRRRCGRTLRGSARKVSGPPTPGGTSTRCSSDRPPATVPSSVPGPTRPARPPSGPARRGGTATAGRAGARPRGRARSGVSHTGAPERGRSSPSNTPPSRPGPSAAASGRPVARTAVADAEPTGVLVGLQGHRLAPDRRRSRPAPRPRRARRPRASAPAVRRPRTSGPLTRVTRPSPVLTSTAGPPPPRAAPGPGRPGRAARDPPSASRGARRSRPEGASVMVASGPRTALARRAQLRRGRAG